MANGLLFTEDFLNEGVRETETYRALTDDAVSEQRATLAAIFAKVVDPSALNEGQTENRIVQPVLDALGFGGAYDVQTNLDTQGRENVPDYLLFADASAYARAEAAGRGRDARLRHAIAVADAKAWRVALGGRPRDAKETPAGQILRYMSRAETVSERAVKWGVLTNGRYWRLYYQNAKSRIEEYYEADLAWLLDLARDDLFSAGRDKAHELKLFLLIFSQSAFQRSGDGRSFLELALDEGHRWEAKVRTNLSEVVFGQVFPGLVRALATADPERPEALTPHYLEDLREAALTLLYRILFALYAEDRDLLPRRSLDYDDYGLTRMREEIAKRIDAADVFSGKRKGLYRRCVELFDTIDAGDDDLGVPPYNGGLFAHDRSPLLRRSELSDKAFAPLFDKLSRTEKEGRGLVLINYRDLSVRELGAIYERLLEFQPVASADGESGIGIRANAFARKGSGSYYTPDELVQLIVARAVGPLIDERKQAFHDKAEALRSDTRPKAQRRAELETLDPASRILDLKIVDPAMGSGHFLVSLIDYLADEIHRAIGQAAEEARYCDYVSPLNARLDAVRGRIRDEADRHGWNISDAQLEDKNLIKRFALKRCIYGVDKNPMAVELAKVALWLHTFTAGAPLSFLDHHLRCGDSLFGERVRKAMDELAGGGLFINQSIQAAQGAAAGMQRIEALTDAELGEVRESEAFFRGIKEDTAPLRRFLSFWHALRWFKPLPEDEKRALKALLDGRFGDPVEVAAGLKPPNPPANITPEQLALIGEDDTEPEQLAMLPGASVQEWRAVKRLIARAHALADEQRFFHWEVAFPGVWTQWESAAPKGGFDAVIGNPPWDRMKMQEVEWFADRAPQVALQQSRHDRQQVISRLEAEGSPLIGEYRLASSRAETAMTVARQCGAYPLLSAGDVNLYSLFVERALALVNPLGLVGLLAPTGILTDKVSEKFLREIIPAGRLAYGLDFFNRKRDGSLFFPAVYYRYKFCVLILLGAGRPATVMKTCFFARDVDDVTGPKLIRITPEMIGAVNTETFTVPVFRSAEDARLAMTLATEAGAERLGAEGVTYRRMYDMGSDSDLFSTPAKMAERGGYPVSAEEWRVESETWQRLYEGKMVQAFDHRSASIGFYEGNVFRTGESDVTTLEKYADAHFLVGARFYVKLDEKRWGAQRQWALAFKDITSTTNTRTMIAAIVPKVGCGHTLPVLLNDDEHQRSCELTANLNAFVLDFFARQKVNGNHLTWGVASDLPVVTSSGYARTFGAKSAADIVRDHVLRLSYTAHDLEPFARDLGYDSPPFVWDETERMHLRARLDALYFHLYGVTDEADVRHILSTFPIVERKDRQAHGIYRTEALILWYMRALAAGDYEGVAPIATLTRQA